MWSPLLTSPAHLMASALISIDGVTDTLRFISPQPKGHAGWCSSYRATTCNRVLKAPNQPAPIKPRLVHE